MWFRSFMPDILIGCKGSDTKAIYNIVNHELAHASHFIKAGQAYWADYVSYIITYKGYSNSSSKNSGVCGVGEMWGYAVGNIQQKNKYSDNTTKGTNYWFKPQIISDLYYKKILSLKQIYNSLTPGVRSHLEMKDRMVANDIRKKSQINQTFYNYGFYKYKMEWEFTNNLSVPVILETDMNSWDEDKTEIRVDVGTTVLLNKQVECNNFVRIFNTRYENSKVLIKNAYTNKEIRVWYGYNKTALNKQFFNPSSWEKATEKAPVGNNTKWTFTINNSDL